MAWLNPSSPNLPDFLLFVQNSMQVPSSAMPPAVVQPPGAPGLTPGSGGSLPSSTLFVKITYVSAYGETDGSAEASSSVTGPDGSLMVASPAMVALATGYNVYAATATGQELLQNGTPVPIGTPFVINALAAYAVTVPTVNTTGWSWAAFAFLRARNLVPLIPAIAGPDYTLTYYNCAGHLLIASAPDTDIIYKDDMGFFAWSRDNFDLLEPSSGVISSSGDQGTYNSLFVPESLQNLTVGDLFFFKTPYGRMFLAYCQDFGEIAGLT